MPPPTPAEHQLLDQALSIVERDVEVVVGEAGGLRLVTSRGQVFVALDDGRFHGDPVQVQPGDTAARIIAVVAEAAQDTVMGVLWKAWPECPVHHTVASVSLSAGESAAVRDKDAVSWRCSAEEGPPTVATVGSLPGDAGPQVTPGGRWDSTAG